ncbi:hypothetical protein QYF61_019898, partial [Mycteria americana]
MASNHHMAHKSFSVGEQQVQRGTFPRWLAHQLCQEVICHTLQEPPRLFPLCCILFPADIRVVTSQPVPMLDNPFSEVKFPNIQSKPPLAQLEAISSCPIICYLGEETNPQVVVESNKVSPQPPFLQAKQPQLPQPLLIRLVLQTLHQLRCPSLDTLQHLNVSLVVGDPTLNTAFEVWPHQCRVQGHDHFPSPAGHTISDTSQDAIGLVGHLGTLLAHIQPAVDQHPQVLLCLAAFQPVFPKPVVLHGVVVTQVQDLALGLFESQITLCPCKHTPKTLKVLPSKPRWLQRIQMIEKCNLEAVESNEVTPQPPFLQTRQAQSPQPLLIGHSFQPFHQLWCPPLHAFKDLHILLKLWGPELHPVFKNELCRGGTLTALERVLAETSRALAWPGDKGGPSRKHQHQAEVAGGKRSLGPGRELHRCIRWQQTAARRRQESKQQQCQ